MVVFNLRKGYFMLNLTIGQSRFIPGMNTGAFSRNSGKMERWIIVWGIEFATMILFGIAVVVCIAGFGWFLYMIS